VVTCEKACAGKHGDGVAAKDPCLPDWFCIMLAYRQHGMKGSPSSNAKSPFTAPQASGCDQNLLLLVLPYAPL
jgi:hypothetical protein